MDEQTPSVKPWEQILIDLWNKHLKGKIIGIIVVLIVFVIPGSIGVFNFYRTQITSLLEYRKKSSTSISEGESTALNEWVIAISYWETKEEALKAKESFVGLYEQYETIPLLA